MFTQSNAQVDTFICDNGGFEQDFLYYQGRAATNTSGSKTCTPLNSGNPSVYYNVSLPYYRRFEIVSGGTDPLIGIPRTKFGSKSLMLNNRYGNLDQCDGDKDVNRIQKDLE